MLSINQLTFKRDGQHFSYHLNVKAGEALAIQGPSGIGKTTLLNLIAGFEKPASGNIFWQDSDITFIQPQDKPVAMLFQDHNLFEHLSAWKNLQLGVGAPSKDQLLQASEQLGVAHLLEKKPPQLSGGQRQRLALIRTLLRPEPIILLDEPFSELDPNSRELAANWCKQQYQQTNKALILVTHQANDIQQMNAKHYSLS